MPYKCLIVGLGQIGMGYDLLNNSIESIFTHCRALSLHALFEISGAVDSSAAQRSSFADHFRKPVYEDIPSAFGEQKFDVVVISSPTSYHCIHIHEVLALSNPIAILCEKPLAYLLEEAKDIVKSCETNGVRLFVNYMRRSDPGSIEVKRRIANGLIASPLKGIVWYSKGLLHNGSHFLNLMQFWLGFVKRYSIINKGRMWNDLDTEPDFFVEFERGSIFFCAAWEENYSHYTVELISPSGRLKYDNGGGQIQWQGTIKDPDFDGYNILNPVPEIIDNEMNRYQYNVAEQLAQALGGTGAYLCSGAEALDTLEVIGRIINSRNKD